MPNIKKAVDRFLGWQLPVGFAPDCADRIRTADGKHLECYGKPYVSDEDQAYDWGVSDTVAAIRALATQQAGEPDYKELYYDLIMQVARKHPDESRHDTAKRYINERENRPSEGPCARAGVRP